MYNCTTVPAVPKRRYGQIIRGTKTKLAGYLWQADGSRLKEGNDGERYNTKGKTVKEEGQGQEIS